MNREPSTLFPRLKINREPGEPNKLYYKQGTSWHKNTLLPRLLFVTCNLSFISFPEKLKSKFDDQSESESETQSVHMSDQEDDGYYLADTPPDSPVELLPELPPYYPAIQGCRNVEEFHCLNRIEEGAYGVVYRAKDKKTGTGHYEVEIETKSLVMIKNGYRNINWSINKRTIY